MSAIPSTSTKNSHFENKIVDNKGFFQTMEDKIPSLLSIAETRAQTRLEIRQLLAQMKQQNFIRGVTEWTAREQADFFQKVESEIMNAGIEASTMIREKIQVLIEDEIWREINDEGKQYSLQDGDGNTMISDMGKYQNFLDTSFLLAKETTTIPLDLRLTVSETATIDEAQIKLDRYHGKYNALILVDDKANPIGIVRSSAIQEHKNSGHRTLGGISLLSDVFGYYSSSNIELRKTMEDHDINILPIIDSKTNVLIGILTNNSLGRKEIQYYSTTSITRLSLDMISRESKKEQS